MRLRQRKEARRRGAALLYAPNNPSYLLPLLFASVLDDEELAPVSLLVLALPADAAPVALVSGELVSVELGVVAEADVLPAPVALPLALPVALMEPEVETSVELLEL